MSHSDSTARVIRAVTAVVGVLLGLRFVLRAFNADGTNRLVSWIYDMSAPAIEPFFEWFKPVRVSDGFNLEVQTLFALATYTFIAFAALAAVGAYKARADGVKPKRRFAVSLKR